MEEWRDVPGYEGMYQISISTKEGKCRRIWNNGIVHILERKPRKEHKHYRQYWSLCKNGKQKCHQAAKWIAMTFPELVENEWFPGAEIDHIDTDRLNNHPSNLRWVTKKENANNPLTRQHITEHNRIKSAKRRKWVIQLSKNNEILHFYQSVVEAEKETGIKRTNITNCCNGKVVKNGDGYLYQVKTAGGYKWKYAE